MSRNVICISRTLGAAGEQLATVVAEKLGFRYADEDILSRAAKIAGVEADVIAASERSEGGATYAVAIEQAIRETASEGNVVIVAHGASIPLASEPRALRVLVTASPASRARRLAETDGIDEAGANQAIAESDAARSSYLERIYGVTQELPTTYDVTINTDTMSIPKAARVVMQAALTL